MTNFLIEDDNEQQEPAIITVFGQAGLGKTTLGALFPDPVFMQAEKGLRAGSLPGGVPMPARLKPLTSVEDMIAQFDYLLNGDHSYATLVVDTVTSLDSLFVQHVVDSDPSKPRSINQACGGFGGGMMAVAGLHRSVREWAEVLREQRGMHVVFLGHCDVKREEPPDTEAFTKYALSMSEKAMHHYVNNVDCVAFIKLKTNVIGEEGKRKAITNGKRLLICVPSPANVSKNRLGITENLEFGIGENPLLNYI